MTKIDVVAHLAHGGDVRSRIYGIEGISRTVIASDFKDPQLIAENDENRQSSRGGYFQESTSCAMRGRGDNNVQQVELRSDSVANCLTTVSKDSMVAEPEQEVLRRVQEMVKGKRDGTATAVLEDDKTIRGCYNQAKHDSSISEMIVQHEQNPCNTLTTAHKPKVYGPSLGYRIRKLTERECFRLMDVSDTDIDKIQATGLSKTQQYKMAGNSIVVSCLYGIFKNLFVTEGERRDGQLMLPIRPTEEPV